MSADDSTSRAFTLRRWSKRKLAAAHPEPKAAPAPATAAPSLPPDPASAGRPAAEPAAGPATLPPVESLTIDSDFAAFLQPKVEEGLKRQALKQLFRDPRFNVMDGLDVYIDDYSKPDPISADVVREMVQGRYIFAPPETRVNDEGVVEDVPAADVARDVVAVSEEALAEGEAPMPAPARISDAAEPAAPSVPSASSAGGPADVTATAAPKPGSAQK